MNFFLFLQSLITWSKRSHFKQFLFFTWMTYSFLIYRYNYNFLSSMFFFEIVIVVVFIFFIVFRLFIEFEVFDIIIWSFWFFFILFFCFFYHVCFDNILYFQIVVLLFSNFVDWHVVNACTTRINDLIENFEWNFAICRLNYVVWFYSIVSI